jgi:hypothetical protein
MKKVLVLLGILFFALSVAQNTLNVIKVDDAALDASAAFWADAPKLEQATKSVFPDTPGGPVVTMQAAHDGEFIVFRAAWEDPTETVLKEAWIWDGNGWTQSEEDEDRLMIVWPIGNNAEFASKGCGAACHFSEDRTSAWMASDSEDVTYDNWHWKSARTNAVGYADDQWWGLKGDDEDTGRKNDTRDSGGYANNAVEDGSGPAFMSSESTEVNFIFKGKEIPIDTAALKVGDRIPAFVIEPAVGSRGDVQALGSWQDGKWVLVMRRALNTGNDDDVEFIVGKPLPFGMSVIDNGGDANHKVTEDKLVLDW